MCPIMKESALLSADRTIVTGSVDVDLDAAIDSKLAQLPTKLLAEIQQHELRQRSYLTHIHTKVPCSLLNEIRQYQNQEQKMGNQNEILDIVCGILTVAAAAKKGKQEADNNLSFLSPMNKTSRALSVDKSKLSTLSLDSDDSENLEEEEIEKASVATTSETTITSAQEEVPKKVHFNPRTSIHLTITREEMTKEEKKAYWLQDEEFALIRMRDGYLGNLVEQKQREIDSGIETDSYVITPSSIAISPQHWICTRGLEYKMRLGFLKTKGKRLMCLEQVLVEQERQWDEHWDDGRNLSPFSYDFEAVALVSYAVSTECKRHAERVAANDRRDVEEVLRVEAQEESKE